MVDCTSSRSVWATPPTPSSSAAAASVMSLAGSEAVPLSWLERRGESSVRGSSAGSADSSGTCRSLDELGQEDDLRGGSFDSSGPASADAS